MLIALFRRDRPALLLALPVLALATWWGAPQRSPMPPEGMHMPLFTPVLALMQHEPWTVPMLGIMLTIGIGLQLVFLANDVELFERRNHLPALLFPLLFALAPGGQTVTAALAGMPFVLWAIHRSWLPHGRRGGLSALFDAGFLLGVAALIFLPYAFLLVVIWASGAVMRPFHWRDHLVPVVGLLLAFFLCWGTLRALDLETWHPLGPMTSSRGAASMEVLAYRPLAIALLLFVPPAALAFARRYRRSVMQGKNLLAAFLAFTVACFIIIAFGQLVSGSLPMVLAAVPLCIFFSAPLLQARRTWLAEAGGVVLIGLAVWAQLGTDLSSPA